MHFPTLVLAYVSNRYSASSAGHAAAAPPCTPPPAPPAALSRAAPLLLVPTAMAANLLAATVSTVLLYRCGTVRTVEQQHVPGLPRQG